MGHMNVCETSAPWGVCGETETNVGGDCSLEDVGGEISGDFPKCFLDRQLEHVGTWLFAGSQRFAAEVVGIAVKGSPLVDRIIWRRCWCCRPWFRPGLGLIFCCWVWRKDQGVPGFLSFPHFKRCSNDLRSRLYKSETTIFRSWNPHIFPNFSPFFPHFFPIFPHFLRCKSPWTSHFQGSLNGLSSRPRMAWFGPFWMRTKQLRWCPGAYEPWDVHEILSDFKVLYINILDSGTVEC